MIQEKSNKEIILESIKKVNKDFPFLNKEKDWEIIFNHIKNECEEKIILDVNSNEFKEMVEFFL